MNYMDDFSVLLNGPDEVSILRNKILKTVRAISDAGTVPFLPLPET